MRGEALVLDTLVFEIEAGALFPLRAPSFVFDPDLCSLLGGARHVRIRWDSACVFSDRTPRRTTFTKFRMFRTRDRQAGRDFLPRSPFLRFASLSSGAAVVAR